MEVSAEQLADLLGGVVDGNPNVTVNRPAKIEEGEIGTLTFLANPKYEPYIYTTGASIVLVSNEFKARKELAPTLVRVADVYSSMAKLMQKFQSEVQTSGAPRDSAFIHPDAKVGANVKVGAFAVIEAGAVIGDNSVIYPNVYVGNDVKLGVECTLYPGVRIYYDCILGDRVTLHANTVVGSDGFGYAPTDSGAFEKIPQVGNVIIGDDVEIGANAVVDRASMGSTRIDKGAKLDNLVHIAHNVQVGAHSALAAQVGIAGSAKLGQGCQLGGQAGVVGHVEVGDHTLIQGQSGVIRGTKPNSKIQGSPAIPYVDYFKSYAIFRKLPDLSRELKKLQSRIAELEKGGAK